MAKTIHHTLTTEYFPSIATPIGFEVTFEIYDTSAGGGTGQTFATSLSFEVTNATAWSLDAANCTGLKTTAGYVRHPAEVYDSSVVSASWTERISDVAATPTTYVLRGKFDAPGGIVQVSALSQQVNDSSNTSGLETGGAVILPVGL